MSIRLAALLLATALATSGCPTVDLGEMPVSPGACRPDPAYFEEVIWPQIIDTGNEASSCVEQGACHQQENGRSAFRVSRVEPIDFAANYKVTTRFLNCGTPEASAFLTKPLGGVDSHGGGDIFEPGSEAEELFLGWFVGP